MEQSLVIIKPDGTIRRAVGARVLKALMERGYHVQAFKEMNVSDELAKKHYAIHSEKSFFPWLVQFITSARVLAMVLEADSVIDGVREALGATFVQKASPESLRGKYGTWAGVNIAHASDSPETAVTEIELWKTEGGLQISNQAEAEAKQYINRYSSNDFNNTLEIRETVKKAIEEGNTSQNVLLTLQKLYGMDAEGVPESEVAALAKAVFDFIIEEVEKK
ncbi:MAG: hypothetical protein EAX81_03425 [Candidatus Thorarchaeota archaeon]|nr:hypothetical protein [Candidatus Thorarchaeota archaeon]